MLKVKAKFSRSVIKHLNAELNPNCHILSLLGAHPILHVSRIRVKKSAIKVYSGNVTRH
jgi:hypothetical protein